MTGALLRQAAAVSVGDLTHPFTDRMRERGTPRRIVAHMQVRGVGTAQHAMTPHETGTHP